MKKIIFILLLMTTKLTFGQIINGDFEVWDTTYMAPYSAELSSIFGVPNPYGGTVTPWVSGNGNIGISQTTDSYSGNYAVILHNWYGYAFEWITYRDSINYRPQYLQGYFKYITGGDNTLSQGTANITLTRFNGTTNDTIATGTYQFDSTDYYTPFQIDLNYSSDLNPDSIDIYIINGNNSCVSDIICNLLYLDHLTLSNTPLSNENINLSNRFVTVYPNPCTTQAILQTNRIFKDATLTVFNAFGQTVKQIKNISGQNITLHRDHLPGGLYIIQLTEANQVVAVNKLIITE